MGVEQQGTLGGYHNLCSNGAMEQTGDSEMPIRHSSLFLCLCLFRLSACDVLQILELTGEFIDRSTAG